MAVTNDTGLSPRSTSPNPLLTRSHDPFLRAAAVVNLVQALLWLSLLVRWATFSIINWRPLAVELSLANWSPVTAYAVYGALLALSLVAGLGLWRETSRARPSGLVAAAVTLAAGLGYYLLVGEFYGAIVLVGLGGMALLLLTRQAAWSMANVLKVRAIHLPGTD